GVTSGPRLPPGPSEAQRRPCHAPHQGWSEDTPAAEEGPQAGQGLLGWPAAALQERGGDGPARPGVRLPRPPGQEARLPVALDPAHQRGVPRAWPALLGLHEWPQEGGGDPGPEGPRRPRRQRPHGFCPAGRDRPRPRRALTGGPRKLGRADRWGDNSRPPVSRFVSFAARSGRRGPPSGVWPTVSRPIGPAWSPPFRRNIG